MELNRIEKFSPKTNNKLYDVEIMSSKQVGDICKKAKVAFSKWKKTSIEERKMHLKNFIEIVRNNSNRITQTIMSDVEKPFCEAETEVIEACDIMEYYCNEIFEGIDIPFEIAINKEIWPNKKAYGLYQPSGVYAVIKPWNYPFELTIWAVVPLLLAGNTIVYKPSELSTATGVLLTELINMSGFPDGVFNILQGDKSTGKSLIENTNIVGLSFTGSSKVGKEIYEKNKNLNLKLSLEMGGSDYSIVLNDEIDNITIPGILWGSFSNAGQVCVAIEKVLVSNEIYDTFITKLVNETKKLEIGKEISPIISEKQYIHAQNIINDAIKHGGKVLCGGITYEENNLKHGNYILLTIIECSDYEYLSRVEEIFAPIILIAPFRNVKEAIKLVNKSQYGLGCSIWTGNHIEHKFLYEELEVGMIWINEVNLPMPQVPWIGRKDSGLGFNLSKNAVYDAMNLKVIHIDNDNSKRSWWYPYK